VAFSYDAMGRLHTRETISGGGLCPDRSSDRTDTFVYDEDSTNLGRLTSAHFGGDFTKEYNYDAQGVSTMHALVHQNHRLEVRYAINLLGQLVEKQYVDTPGFSMGVELGKHGLPEALKIGTNKWSAKPTHGTRRLTRRRSRPDSSSGLRKMIGRDLNLMIDG